MSREKIIDAIYITIFIVGVAILIWFMASKNFLFLLAGFGVWSLMPIIDKLLEKHKPPTSNDTKKASD